MIEFYLSTWPLLHVYNAVSLNVYPVGKTIPFFKASGSPQDTGLQWGGVDENVPKHCSIVQNKYKFVNQNY